MSRFKTVETFPTNNMVVKNMYIDGAQNYRDTKGLRMKWTPKRFIIASSLVVGIPASLYYFFQITKPVNAANMEEHMKNMANIRGPEVPVFTRPGRPSHQVPLPLPEPVTIPATVMFPSARPWEHPNIAVGMYGERRKAGLDKNYDPTKDGSADFRWSPSTMLAHHVNPIDVRVNSALYAELEQIAALSRLPPEQVTAESTLELDKKRLLVKKAMATLVERAREAEVEKVRVVE